MGPPRAHRHFCRCSDPALRHEHRRYETPKRARGRAGPSLWRFFRACRIMAAFPQQPGVSMKLRSLAVLLIPVAAACGGGHRTSGITPMGTYTTQVQGYLSRLASNARRQGFNRVAAGPVYGHLDNGASTSIDMTVVGGNAYV